MKVAKTSPAVPKLGAQNAKHFEKYLAINIWTLKLKWDCNNPTWFFLEGDSGAKGGPQTTPNPSPGPVNSAPKHIWNPPNCSV